MGEFDFKNIKDAEDRSNLHHYLRGWQSSLATHNNIRVLKEQYVEEWRQELGVHRLTAIAIPEDIIENMNFSQVTKSIADEWNPFFRDYTLITIDKNCKPINGEQIDWNEEKLLELSTKGQLLLFMGDKATDIYVSGGCYKKGNLFTTEKLRRQFRELYKIGDLEKCISEYQEYLDDPGNIGRFFVPKSIYHNIEGAEDFTRLVINKPEEVMRNSLKKYLNTHTQYRWNKEVELNSRGRLDLYTEADGLPVTIEVKWLGRCINASGSAVSGTSYSTARIKAGVRQTLKYIKELHQDHKFLTLINYLFVFDAREDDLRTDFDLNNSSYIKTPLLPYFQRHYKTLPMCTINNS